MEEKLIEICFVYCINHNGNIIYIGSTNNLNRRKNYHNYDLKNNS